MELEMIRYILECNECKQEKIELQTMEDITQNRHKTLNNIERISTIKINNTEMDINDYPYLEYDIDLDDNDILKMTFYTYQNFGDVGYDLVYETEIRTKLSEIEIFMLI